MTNEDFEKSWNRALEWGSEIDKQDKQILLNAVLIALQNPIRSDDGLYDYYQGDIGQAISNIKKVMNHDN